MTLPPTITTIIVTYRRPQLLAKAIQSVLNQTYPHFQILICDDASEDGTKEIAKPFVLRDSRVKYHCHPKNIGMIENYKFGLSQIKTDFFSILSDDDVLLPDFFSNALLGFQSFPESCLFAGSTIIMTEKGKIIRIPNLLWPREGVFFPHEGMLEMIGKYPIPNGVLFRKHVIDHVKIDEENPLTWDCDYLLQCASRFPIILSYKPCALFLQHLGSYSFSQKGNRWEKSYNHLAKRVEQHFQLTSELAKDAKSRIFLDFYNWLIENKRYGQAASLSKQIASHIELSRKAQFVNKLLHLPFALMHLLHAARKLKHKILVEKTQQAQYGQYHRYMK